MSLSTSKTALRSQLRTALEALTPDDLAARSIATFANLQKLAAWRTARTVFAFLSMADEIDTERLVGEGLAEGKRIAAPRPDPKTRTMVAAQLRSVDDFTTGHFGIREPEGDVIAPGEFDLIIVPGLGFDVRGHRLGHGAGYYDRFLQDPRCRASALYCGYALEIQVVGQVPVEPHDQLLDLLVTDVAVRH